jgi:hypothetical protein
MAQRHALDGNRNEFWGFAVDTLKRIYGAGFRTISPQGYLLYDCLPDEAPPEYAHYFCGPHEVPGADCPNCQKPLVRMLAIDTRDPRLELTYCPFDTLSLFFCFTCKIPEGGLLYYQMRAPDGRVEILSYEEGKQEPEYVPFYPEPYPPHFPGVPVRLVPLSEQQQWYLIESERLGYESARAWETLDDERWEELERKKEQLLDGFYLLPHRVRGSPEFTILESTVRQIGGFPQFVQRWEGTANQCPVCANEMVFLAALCDVNADPRGFSGGGEFPHFPFAWCPECFVIGAAWVQT